VDFSPEHVLLGRERLARATAVLLELPERTRVIFVLRRLEGMKYLDIAARLGISVSAVEKHMERAVARLMEGAGEE
jgi:RNA polymerase sigma-70 factor (ECF subfamily)